MRRAAVNKGRKGRTHRTRDRAIYAISHAMCSGRR